MHSAPYKTLAERLQWVKEDPVQSPWMEVSLSQGKTRFTPLKSEFGLKSKTQRHKLSPTHLTDQETLYLLFAIQTNVTCTLSANKIINPALIFIAGNAKSMNPPPPPSDFLVSNSICSTGCKAHKKNPFSSLGQIELPLDFWHFLSPASEEQWCVFPTQTICAEVLFSVRAPALPFTWLKSPWAPAGGQRRKPCSKVDYLPHRIFKRTWERDPSKSLYLKIPVYALPNDCPGWF